MKEVLITREPVELFKILKFEGLANSGGEAKKMIDAGQVSVNGQVETQRRKKINSGDVLELNGQSFNVHLPKHGE